MTTNNKKIQNSIISNISVLSNSVKKLNLYVSFLSKYKPLDITKIEKEINDIKLYVDNLESILHANK